MALLEPLVINIFYAVVSFFVAYYCIPGSKDIFMKAGLKGRDMSKKEKKEIPESLGAIIGMVFLVCMFLFIPIPFVAKWFQESRHDVFPHNESNNMKIKMPNETYFHVAFWKQFMGWIAEFVSKENAHGRLSKCALSLLKMIEGRCNIAMALERNSREEFIAALLSICCMILLGYADDTLDLKWRYKLVLPTIASLPLLMVYYVNGGLTTIVVPKPLRFFVGMHLNLGFLYYVYMGMLAVFCTNAINILAGVNGLETGQSVVIAISILVFNAIELNGDFWQSHLFSMYFIFPYVAVSLALLYHNWYPSSVFVGDTFCYFSGMTFAVVAILGHFSKTMLLFFIPQILNFLYSVPQLFRFIPCPRHRLPRYNEETDLLECSTTTFKQSDLNFIGKILFILLSTLRIIKVRNNMGENKEYIEINNLTLINFSIYVFGPLHEKSVTLLLLLIQAFGSCLAFFVRYEVAKVFYDT